MATYKYDIYFDFMGEGDPVRVTGENILALAIDYAYDSEAIQPTVIMKARLDRNLVDKLVTNKATGKIQLHVDKTMVDNDPSGGIRKPYIVCMTYRKMLKKITQSCMIRIVTSRMCILRSL